ncbi:unnamed protein product [Durusdinium trenchii]|uniref:Uncharacterized protein n=2 Tax=Durusdinium trenchii TaxID=1381693 RepID=A0ABP0K2J5_9DINO
MGRSPKSSPKASPKTSPKKVKKSEVEEEKRDVNSLKSPKSPKSPKSAKKDTKESAAYKSIAVCLSSGHKLHPTLVAGVFSKSASPISAGSKLYAPCGPFVQVYSVKSHRVLATLGPHEGQVTALSAGSKQPDGPYPIATGSSSGELCIWDGKGGNCSQPSTRMNLGNEVLSLHWPRANQIIVMLGEKGGEAWLEQITVSSLESISRGSTLPLRAEKAGRCDVDDDIVALIDGKELCVWKEGWSAPRRYSHASKAFSVAIDPYRRYVAVGDQLGVVWFWWGALDDVQDTLVPARWHWHAGPVRALTHSGPLLLSAGDEGVLCVRNAEDETTKYIPRFRTSFRHLTVSQDGQICCGCKDSSIALIDSLHGVERPRYVPSIDHALSEPMAREGKKRRLGRQERGTWKRAKVQPTLPFLHSLTGGSVVATAGRRVTFLHRTEEPQPSETLRLKRGGHASSDPEQCWVLQQLVVSSGGSCIMTCETRILPSLENFDPGFAFSCVLKWWRRDSLGEYVLDSVSNNPHMDDVTVAFGSPEDETVFFTASRDKGFKIWDYLDSPYAPAVRKGEEVERKRCWQFIAAGKWRSTIVSGCFSADASVVATGVVGSIILWKAQEGVAVDQLSLEKADTPKQMCSVVTSAFLLIAYVQGAKKDEIICWNLFTLQMVTKLDLRAALPGKGEFQMRYSIQLPFQILAFRRGEAVFTTWSLTQDEPKLMANGVESPKKKRKLEKAKKDLCPSLTFVEQASMTLPAGQGIEDLAFHKKESSKDEDEYSVMESLMCWTSAGLLWNINLSDAKLQEEQPEEEPLEEKAGSALSNLTGGRMAVSKLETSAKYPLRTTAAQQAGLVPRLLKRILPPGVPSHMLPPPAALWKEFTSTYAKAPDAAAAPFQAETLKKRSKAATKASNLAGSDLRRPLPSIPDELVDQDWMDALVEAM